MFWFRRPPYLRFAAGGALIALALMMEARQPPTVMMPFADQPIAAGENIGPENTELKAVPAGLLPTGGALGEAARVDIAEGEPITGSLTADHATLPPGWWGIEMETPSGAVPGTELRLIVGDGIVVPALVTSLYTETTFGTSTRRALIAVPAESAITISTALHDQRLQVLIAGW